MVDAVGLPVDSVALIDTQEHLRDLRDATSAHDHSRIQWAVAKLHNDMSLLGEDERRDAQPEVEIAVAGAAASIIVWSAPSLPVDAYRQTNVGATGPAPQTRILDPEPSSPEPAGSAIVAPADIDESLDAVPSHIMSAEPAEVERATASEAPETPLPAEEVNTTMTEDLTISSRPTVG